LENVHDLLAESDRLGIARNQIAELADAQFAVLSEYSQQAMCEQRIR
jgi:hypothetical protein